MKKIMFMLILLTGWASYAAEPAPAGKKLFNDNCLSSCHKLNNDPKFIRDNPMAKNYKSLLRLVNFCVSQTGAEIFPEDEVLIADYLNRKYYHFPVKK